MRPDRRAAPFERGAVMVETALTVPVMFLLIFGIIEFGVAARSFVAVEGSTSEAVRGASIAGDDIDADHHILEVLDDAMPSFLDDQLQYVVVYRASGPDEEVPVACLTGSVASGGVFCNHYTPADLVRGVADFGCQDVQDLDEYWCPTTRDVTAATADYIGVHVAVRRGFLTGLFDSDATMAADMILRLEPRDR